VNPLNLLIVFQPAKLPKQYNFMFTSIVKAALELSSPETIKELYSYGEKANKKAKSFTGSIFLQDYVIEETEIKVNGEIRVTISSPDPEFILYLYNGIVQKKMFRYQAYEVQLAYVKVLFEKLPTKRKVLFKTNSPIAVKNKEGRFLDVNDPSYSEDFNYIANVIVKAVTGRNLLEPLSFTPVIMKKKVVQLKHHSFAKLNKESILFVNCFEGSFILEGAVEDLAILASSGLGVRRSQFFGSIQMLQE